MLKGHLDAIVLSVIAGGANYGYAMIKEINHRSQQAIQIPEGTVYPALHRLEDDGLISSEWEVLPNGRKRRVYALTKAGTRRLEEKCDEWTTFARAMSLLLSPARA